jgi:hypothetical protein
MTKIRPKANFSATFFGTCAFAGIKTNRFMKTVELLLGIAAQGAPAILIIVYAVRNRKTLFA